MKGGGGPHPHPTPADGRGRTGRRGPAVLFRSVGYLSPRPRLRGRGRRVCAPGEGAAAHERRGRTSPQPSLADGRGRTGRRGPAVLCRSVGDLSPRPRLRGRGRRVCAPGEGAAAHERRGRTSPPPSPADGRGRTGRRGPAVLFRSVGFCHLAPVCGGEVGGSARRVRGRPPRGGGGPHPHPLPQTGEGERGAVGRRA